MKKRICIASRGRNPDNPSDRSKGAPMEQRYEPKMDGCTNSITTVQKDNLILEINNMDQQFVWGGLQERQTPREDGISPSLTAATGMGGGQTPIMTEQTDNTEYRIRKLTSRETWRLMGFSDKDYEAAATVSSKTQLYRQCGNSIVENVLVAIFGQMIPGKENVYKERKPNFDNGKENINQSNQTSESIGFIENGTNKHQSNTLHDPNRVAPTMDRRCDLTKIIK